VHAAVRLDDTADGANLQRKGRILERLLHLAVTKPAQIAVIGVRGTVRVGLSERSKLVCARPDLCLVPPEDLDGLLFGTCDIRLSMTQVRAQKGDNDG
jgi:hypothetical protein